MAAEDPLPLFLLGLLWADRLERRRQGVWVLRGTEIHCGLNSDSLEWSRKECREQSTKSLTHLHSHESDSFLSPDEPLTACATEMQECRIGLFILKGQLELLGHV